MTRLWIFFKLIDYLCCCWKLWNNSGERCFNSVEAGGMVLDFLIYDKHGIQMLVSASSPAEAVQANVDQQPSQHPKVVFGFQRLEKTEVSVPSCRASAVPSTIHPAAQPGWTDPLYRNQTDFTLFFLRFFFFIPQNWMQTTNNITILTAWSSLEKNRILTLNYVVSSSHFESDNTFYSNAKDFIKFLYLLYNHQKKTVEVLRSSGGISPTALPAREHALPFGLNGQQNATERRHAPSDNSIGDVQLSIDYWEAAPSIGHKIE